MGHMPQGRKTQRTGTHQAWPWPRSGYPLGVPINWGAKWRDFHGWGFKMGLTCRDYPGLAVMCYAVDISQGQVYRISVCFPDLCAHGP